MSPAAVGSRRVDARSGSTRSSRASIAASSDAPVGAVVENVGAVETGCRGGLDQEVRPTRIIRVVGEVEAVGEAAGAERQIALGVGGDRVEVDTERARRERLLPCRLRRGEVVVDEETVAERHQPLAERAPVERVAAASRQGGECQREAGTPHAGPRAAWPARRVRRAVRATADRAGRARRRAAGWPGTRRPPAPAPERGVARSGCSRSGRGAPSSRRRTPAP